MRYPPAAGLLDDRCSSKGFAWLGYRRRRFSIFDVKFSVKSPIVLGDMGTEDDGDCER
jgi:hypothetical protein